MATPTFCSMCDRTVYVSDGDEFVCPVCSSVLPEVVAPSDVEPVGAAAGYYLG